MSHQSRIFVTAAEREASIWAELGARSFIDWEQNANFMSAVRAYKDNVVIVDKGTDHGSYHLNRSAALGYWLSGEVWNWSVNPDNYIWNCTGQGYPYAFPTALQGVQMLADLIAGAKEHRFYQKILMVR